jgi:hypothetical protein
VSGLNQLFKIERANGRAKVTAGPLATQLASMPGLQSLLALVSVDEYVDKVISNLIVFLQALETRLQIEIAPLMKGIWPSRLRQFLT